LQRWLRIEANYPRGGASGGIKTAEDGKSTYLRLIRKGKELTMSCSFDGEKWTTPTNPFRNIDMSIPDEVTVGVFLSHSTYQFAHATFDGFTITRPKDEK
jgi:regulation of enolase protein 1 (concanavalin A-like superfamily)